ncbi:capsular polysaccharide biosynthesis protein [Ovoidimarina sediminis]|uniref:capsular polysaccharide biosynthesis protein n=1 Tax=Ovoidimarina sediminis TaxID=3079856 RepID=UPI002907CB6C|nr:capsular polysaccharide biosynthesis protein [Rhodophyticola sp. MJ-SS7]MDU8943444.1 capsular polysaccharide biosynthesis protein [Rhodophyticola sp. MJ-SS7]
MAGTAGAPSDESRAAPARLVVYNAGFLTEGRIRRILELSGWRVSVGVPGAGDTVGVWGQSPTSGRGEAVADLAGRPVVRVEDAFLRSLFPGRGGEPSMGLLIDRSGVHFDASAPSDLETLLATHPLDQTNLLDRARDAAAWMVARHLSKFAATDPAEAVPDAPYVLVIDQTEGDAAVRASGATRATFQDMLVEARLSHPGLPMVVKAHPETTGGHRPGHLGEGDLHEGDHLITAPVSPARLMEGAVAVYTVSSGLGFEAIFHGHRPRVFGTPFYAGWGLTEDRGPLPRRGRPLSRAQLFAGAMILYPAWYDPFRDRLCEVEDVLRALDAEARAWREDRQGWVARGMSRWKRPHLDAFFGRVQPVIHGADAAIGRRVMVWARHATPGETVVRVEDGFLRSRGLGAALTPPASLVLDDLGIYYDPRSESRLERLIAEAAALEPRALGRAEALIARIRETGVTKYNTGGAMPDLPEGRHILVPGQVEDDASLVTAGGEVRRNDVLLALVRERNPGAVVIYKPHPDVLAGYREGAVAAANADIVLGEVDAAAALAEVDEVWTMTSLLGFEALLRGLPVTVTGAPFYAGWGLTDDIGTVPARRTARPSLAALAHAALIEYPRYLDPVTGRPCPPEVIVDRLAEGGLPGPKGVLALMQRLKGRLGR